VIYPPSTEPPFVLSLFPPPDTRGPPLHFFPRTPCRLRPNPRFPLPPAPPVVLLSLSPPVLVSCYRASPSGFPFFSLLTHGVVPCSYCLFGLFVAFFILLYTSLSFPFFARVSSLQLVCPYPPFSRFHVCRNFWDRYVPFVGEEPISSLTPVPFMDPSAFALFGAVPPIFAIFPVPFLRTFLSGPMICSPFFFCPIDTFSHGSPPLPP